MLQGVTGLLLGCHISVTGVLMESKHVFTRDSQGHYRRNSRVVLAVLKECNAGVLL